MNPAYIQSYWQRIRAGLLELLDKFNNDDLDFKPFPGSFSVREIYLHIAQEEYGEIHYGLTGKLDSFPPPYDPQDYPTVNSLKGILSEVHGETLSYLAGLDEGDLEGQVEAGWGGTYQFIDLLQHVIEHEIHHRGELSLILGLLGRQGLDA